MVNAQFQVKQDLTRFINARLRRLDVEAGILKDGPTAKYKQQLLGPSQKVPTAHNKEAGKNSSVTLRKLMAFWNETYNLLLAPWRNKNNKEAIEVTRAVAHELNKGQKSRRLLNAAQAVIRNPIVRGEYGDNSAQWQKVKGFNKLLINTGRLFASIVARYKRV